MSDNNALQGFVSQLEDIAASRAELNADAKAVYDACREAGYNVKAVRQIVTERRQDAEALAAFRQTLEDYRDQLGMMPGDGDEPEPPRRGRGRRSADASFDDDEVMGRA